MKFFRRQQSLLSLFFHLSLCPFLSHSLKLSPSSPASLLLPSHPSLSLFALGLHTFLPRFFFVSQLFQLLSLSISLSTDGPECKTLSVECIWGYQQSGEELISLLLCRVIPSPESQHFAPLFQLTSKQHQGHTQYHFV